MARFSTASVIPLRRSTWSLPLDPLAPPRPLTPGAACLLASKTASPAAIAIQTMTPASHRLGRKLIVPPACLPVSGSAVSTSAALLISTSGPAGVPRPSATGTRHPARLNSDPRP
jgi:hypothetical protein